MKDRIVLSYSKEYMLTRPLDKDKDGYYLVRLGGFNVYNFGGDFYLAKGVKELLNHPDSLFRRRLNSGTLYGEAGHPKPTPNMTRQDFIKRNMDILESNYAFHIKDIIIEDTGQVTKNMGEHGNIIHILGWIKPVGGNNGEILKSLLDNPQANVCFSVRSLSNDTVVNGVVLKHTIAILTYDWVTEGGIRACSKFDTVDSRVYTTKDKRNPMFMNTESALSGSISTDLGGLDIENNNIEVSMTIDELKDIANNKIPGLSTESVEFFQDALRTLNYSNIDVSTLNLLRWK